MSDDLLIRVDAQVSGFNAEMGSATKSTLQLEAALKSATATQERYQAQLAAYGKDSAEAQRALATAQRSNAALAEKSAAAQAKASAAASKVGHTMLLAGAAVGVGLGLAVHAAVDFQESMEKIISLVGVSKTQVSAWSDQILALSRNVGVGPQALSDALFYVASAGFRGSAAMDVLTASAKASAAGLGDTATVADAVTSAVNAYGSGVLKASDVTDTLVAAVREGKMPVDALAGSIGAVLPVAAEVGVSFQEIAGTAAALSRSGADVSRTMTGVRFLLTSLIKPTTASAAAFASIGLSAADIRKEVADKGLLSVLTELHNKLPIQDFLAVTGGARGVAVGLGLVGKNAKQVADVMDNVGHATGATDTAFEHASQTAQFKLSAALASLQADAIQLGSVLLPALSGIVDKVGAVANAFGDLPGPVKEAAVVLGVAAAAMALLGGTALTMVPKIAALKKTMTDLSAASGGKFSAGMIAGRSAALGLAAGLSVLAAQTADTNKTLSSVAGAGADIAFGFSVGGPIGAALGAGVGLFQAMGDAAAESAKAQEAVTAAGKGVVSTLNQQTGALTKNTDAFVTNQLVTSGAAAAAQALGISIQDLVGAAEGGPDAFAAVNAQLVTVTGSARTLGDVLSGKTGTGFAGGASFGQTAKQIDLIRNAIGSTADPIKAYQDNLYKTALAQAALHNAPTPLDDEAIKATAVSTQHLAASTHAAAISAKALNAAFTALNATLSDRGSVRDYQAAIDAATAALKKNGATLNVHTAAGREDAAALDDIAAKAIAHAQAMDKDGKSIHAQTQFIDAARKTLIDQAVQFGMTQAKAKAYADQVLKIPKSANTNFNANTGPATAAIKKFIDYLTTLHPTIDVNAEIAHDAATASNAAAYARATSGHADGGWTGPGSKYQPAGIVHANEFVVPSEIVNARGVAGVANAVGMSGYANGGYTGRPSSDWSRFGSHIGTQIQRQANVNIGRVDLSVDKVSATWLRRQAQRAVDMAAS